MNGPDVAAARKAPQKQQPRLLILKRLVFIDETSVSTTIIRVLYGRALQGERLVQKAAAWDLENYHIHRSLAT